MPHNWSQPSDILHRMSSTKPPPVPQSKHRGAGVSSKVYSPHVPFRSSVMNRSKISKVLDDNPSTESHTNESKTTHADDNNNNVGAGQIDPVESYELNTAIPSGKILGRSFLDDEEAEDTHTAVDICKLSSLFMDARTVVQSPARCGAFLSYLFVNSRDPNPTLFYIVAQYYRVMSEKNVELDKDQQRWTVEIFTTFLHQKSPLYVYVPPDVLYTTIDNIKKNLNANVFEVAAMAVLPRIQDQVDKLTQSIQLGVDTWRAPIIASLLVTRSRDDEMKIFNQCLIPRMGILFKKLKMNLGNTPSDPMSNSSSRNAAADNLYTNEQAESSAISLTTVFRYYMQRVADTKSKTGTLSSSFLSRSSENLAGRPSIVTSVDDPSGNINSNRIFWTKVNPFCSKIKQKPHSSGIFGGRKYKKEKNHQLSERIPFITSECSVCGQLFLGLNPIGLSCNNCNLWVHTDCKSNISNLCTKDGNKMVPPSPHYAPRDNIAALAPTDQPNPRVSINDRTSVNGEPFNDLCDDVTLAQGEFESLPPSNIKLDSSSSLTGGTKDTVLSSLRAGNVNRSVSVREYIDPRQMNRWRGRIDTSEGDTKSLPTRSESNVSAISTEANSPPAPESVAELIPNDWSEDPEMMAEESFEAGSEIQRQFPDYVPTANVSKNEKYIRMLCQLEFHQKVSFMVRHLKQYDYLLLRHWPTEHRTLMEELCLDRIPILIELFRSLVTTIDKTKTTMGYEGMAEAVLSWLNDDSSKNLKTWEQHCQALSCTNQLECIGKLVRDYSQRNPDIQPLLKTNFKKINLIEGLKQMRILYFNLPLIANNIVKDLSKRTKTFKAEAKVWEDIYSKLTSLPQTIDDVCMPLVRKINSGNITSTLDKKDAAFRNNNYMVAPFHDMLLSFPRTLFRNWVIAHAEVAVDKLIVSSVNKVNHDYIRERTEMMVVLMHDSLLFLTKDSEKYVLRTYKAAREHMAGGVTSTKLMNSDRLSLVGGSQTSQLQNNQAPSGSLHGSSNQAGVAMSTAGTTERILQGGISRVAPIFQLHNMHATCGEKFGGEHLLNIVFMDPAVLIRVLFKQEKQRSHWYKLLQAASRIGVKPISSVREYMNQPPSGTQAVAVNRAQTEKYKLSTSSRSSKSKLTSSNTVVHKPELPTTDSTHTHIRRFAKKLSTSSVEHLRIPPEKRILTVMSEYERINQQMRDTLCELLQLDDREIAAKCRNMPLEQVKDTTDWLIIQCELNNKWLHYFTESTKIVICNKKWSENRVKSMDFLHKRFRDAVGDVSTMESRKRSSLSSLLIPFEDNPDPTPEIKSRSKQRSLTSSTPNLLDICDLPSSRRSRSRESEERHSAETQSDIPCAGKLKQFMAQMTHAVDTFNMRFAKCEFQDRHALISTYSENWSDKPPSSDESDTDQISGEEERENEEEEDDEADASGSVPLTSDVRTPRPTQTHLPDDSPVDGGEMEREEQIGMDSGIAAGENLESKQSTSDEHVEETADTMNLSSNGSSDKHSSCFSRISDQLTPTYETGGSFQTDQLTPRSVCEQVPCQSRDASSTEVVSPESDSSNTQKSVNRNDSQKSTTSSGFVGSCEE